MEKNIDQSNENHHRYYVDCCFDFLCFLLLKIYIDRHHYHHYHHHQLNRDHNFLVIGYFFYDPDPDDFFLFHFRSQHNDDSTFDIFYVCVGELLSVSYIAVVRKNIR